jgi:hypothetical protein
MNKENTINAILFFLIGLILGLSSQFLFSIFGFCVYNQVSISYLLALGSIAISFFIYLVSTKQTDNIETQTGKIENQTKELTGVSNRIYSLHKELNTAILGQAEGFKELFAKIHEILISVKTHDSKMRLILPIPTLGFFNKNVRSLYEDYKEILIEICKSNKQIELVFLNPFQNVQDNKVLLFFKSIIELSEKNEKDYESSYKRNISELISFFNEIVLSCGWNNNIQINFIDDIFLSGIIASNGGYKSSLFFFIGPELLKSSIHSDLKKKDYVSTAIYNNTSESYTLIDNLIDIQKSKTNTYNLFSKASPDLFCCIMKQILRKVENEEGDSLQKTDLILKEYIVKLNNLSINYIKIDKSHLYLKNNSKTKNLLILPSAAGIYSHFNMGENSNEPRFEMYQEIMSKSNYNCFLYSYSGQGYVDNEGTFSAQKGKIDLTKLNKYFKDKGIKIDCILSFCVSGQIYFDYCTSNPSDLLSNLPLIIWDLPARVNWKVNAWFRRTFKHIKPDIDDFYNTKEPIDSLPAKYGNKILYCYPHRTYNNRDYSEMIKNIEALTDDFKVFEYQKLNHIPNIKDDKNEFDSFIQLLNNY